MPSIYKLLESGLVPDPVIRFGIRQMLSQKLRDHKKSSRNTESAALSIFAEELRSLPLAISPSKANEQHYEVPTEFYKLVLGPHLKYSCAYWSDKTNLLESAEEVMLALTCERAELSNVPMSILELGCGWGSLSMWMAQRYPSATITAVSNSRTQKEYIDGQSAKRGLNNLQVITCDINDFSTNEKFDRIVSVEMFEHLKNYELLFERISKWLQDDGKLFVHIFSHRLYAYHYVNEDGNDWLTEHFFTGGTMPADSLFLYFQKHLSIEKHWRVNGMHYQKTCFAWLSNMDRNRKLIEPILANVYGATHMKRWWIYWRLFFMACEELFRFADGEEWMVSHYLFTNRTSSVR